MQEIGTIYEATVPTWPMDMITLKAIDEPMMIKLRSVLIIKVVRTAFKGMSHPGRT
jgi:hypothetical protein